VDCQTAAESLQAAYDEVADVLSQRVTKSTGGWPYWNLDLGVRSIGDNELADVLASSQDAEGCGDIIEGESRYRGNGLDVALADELEELGEDSVKALVFA
jgi:hypothetical protein